MAPHTHALRPIRARRRRHGRRPVKKARYYALLGDPPATKDDWPGERWPGERDPNVDPGAPNGAWLYWQRIWYFLGLDSGQVWTRVELTNLQRLERRWRKRASGQDVRWNAGETTKGGRLPAAIESALPAREEPDPWPT